MGGRACRGDRTAASFELSGDALSGASRSACEATMTEGSTPVVVLCVRKPVVEAYQRGALPHCPSPRRHRTHSRVARPASDTPASHSRPAGERGPSCERPRLAGAGLRRCSSTTSPARAREAYRSSRTAARAAGRLFAHHSAMRSGSSGSPRDAVRAPCLLTKARSNSAKRGSPGFWRTAFR